MKTILFIASNQEKIRVAKKALSGTSFKILAKKIKCPEIQSDDVSIIAKWSAKYASDKLKEDVVKMDSGLYIPALKGFPGPYSSYIQRTLSAKDILKLMHGKNNRKAYWKDALAYCEYQKKPIVFESFTYGKIALKQQGTNGWELDKIFICDGDAKPIACYDGDERTSKFSAKKWENLVSYFKNVNV